MSQPETMPVKDCQQQPCNAEAHSSWEQTNTLIGKWARFCHDHYVVVILVWVAVVASLVSVVFIAPPDERCVPGSSQGQMQVCRNSDHGFEITHEVHSQRKDALKDALVQGAASFREIIGTVDAAVAERTIASNDYTVMFAYEFPAEDQKSGQSIFTPHTVKAMCEQEATVTFHPLWEQYCLLDPATNACAEQPASIVRFFYSPDERNPAAGGCQLLAEADIEEKAHGVLSNLQTSNGFFVSQDAVEGGYTNSTRSMLQLGSPLAGFRDADDDKVAQGQLYDRFLQGVSCPLDSPGSSRFTGPDPCAVVAQREQSLNSSAVMRIEGPDVSLLRRFEMKGFPDGGPFNALFRSPYMTVPLEPLPNGQGMVSYFWSQSFQTTEFLRMVKADLHFALLAVLAVLLYIWFHVGSLLLAAVAMLQIVLALPAGFFVYYNVLQLHYFSQLHVLAIFLSLGVGADDVFVLVDAWRQSASLPHRPSDAARLHYTLDREVKACFITTFTTCMSFLATSLTPLVTLRAFAVYATTVLLFDYVFTITLFPAVVIAYHKHVARRRWSCCLPAHAATTHSDQEGAPGEGAAEASGDGRDLEGGQHRACHASEGGGREELGVLERVIRDRLAPLICGKQPGDSKVMAWGVVLSFSALAALFAWQASQLAPPSARELAFPAQHTMSRLVAPMTSGWKDGPETAFLSLVFVFGVSSIDRQGFNGLFPDLNRGSAVFDPAFDIATPAAQELFVSACEELRAARCEVEGACAFASLAKPGSDVVCVVEDLIAFYRAAWPGADPAAAHVPHDKFRLVWEKFIAEPPLQLLAGGEAGGFAGAEAEEAAKAAFRARYEGTIVQVEGRVVVATVRVLSSFPSPSPNWATHALFEAVEAMVGEWRARAPPEMKTIFQTDDHQPMSGFTWMAVEDALVRNLLLGVAVCLPVALAVLCVTTGNAVLALYASLSIAFIVAGVLGFVRLLLGWNMIGSLTVSVCRDLGLAESVAGVLGIGFAVDYTIHLGHMYNSATHLRTREEKTAYALTYIGPTVIGGGVTTMLASCVLFLCTFTLFTKMATLLALTVALSVLHALLFFASLCAIAGPANGFGDIMMPSVASTLACFVSALRRRQPQAAPRAALAPAAASDRACGGARLSQTSSDLVVDLSRGPAPGPAALEVHVCTLLNFERMAISQPAAPGAGHGTGGPGGSRGPQ